MKYLLPSVHKDYSNDTRFYDCWSKLTPFSLTEYERVVQLDSDMMALKNMDELMELELDPPSMEGKGDRVFAAGHACACNPLKKPHYPKDWLVFSTSITLQSDEKLMELAGSQRIVLSQPSMMSLIKHRKKAHQLQLALACPMVVCKLSFHLPQCTT